MLMLALVDNAAAACPAHSADIDAALDDAEASYTAMDLDGFGAAVTTATAEAACLSDRPPRSTIAHLHRVEGLHAYFAEKDPDSAAQAFAAARAIEPAYVFPESLVPHGHPVAETYGLLDSKAVKSEPIAEPAHGRLEVDGRASATRPSNRPALVQVVDEDGSVAASAYVWPGDALPRYTKMAASTHVAAPHSAAPRPRRVYLEAVGGWAVGDVDRGYSVRAAVSSDGDAFVTDATSSWTGPSSGDGAIFRLSAGYAPTWYLDAGLAFGIASGQKHLDVGWICATACAGEGQDSTVYDPVSALHALFEVRVRGTPVAKGVLKPYGLVALTAESYDGFTVPDDTSAVDYPNAAAGVETGVTAGLGLSVDATPALSFVVEVPYTFWLSQGEVQEIHDGPATPSQLESTGGTLRMTAGIAVHL